MQASTRRASRTAIILLVLALLVSITAPVDAKKTKKKSKGGAPKALGPSKLARYIECGVCTALAENLLMKSKKTMEEKGGRKKTGEEPILEIIEGICDHNQEHGDWTMQYDVVGQKGSLEVVKQNGYMECGVECQAIEYACDHVRTNVGGSDLSEKIYKGHYTGSVAEFTKALCEKLSDSCTAPKALNDVRIDVPFTAMDGKKWEARKLQRQMKAMGVGGKLYDRDSLNDMMDEEGMGDMGDDLGGMGEGDEGFDFETPIDNETPMPEVSDPLVALADAVSGTAQALAKTAETLADSVVDTIRQGVEYISGQPKDKEL